MKQFTIRFRKHRRDGTDAVIGISMPINAAFQNYQAAYKAASSLAMVMSQEDAHHRYEIVSILDREQEELPTRILAEMVQFP